MGERYRTAEAQTTAQRVEACRVVVAELKRRRQGRRRGPVRLRRTAARLIGAVVCSKVVVFGGKTAGRKAWTAGRRPTSWPLWARATLGGMHSEMISPGMPPSSSGDCG